MANHFHLALAVQPDAVRSWSDQEVIDRWQRIYRCKCEKRNTERRAQMLAGPAKMQLTRERLGSLSWFMKCLNEHVARIANAEDEARGHFWEARFKSQVLLDERALLAAMAYVNLNPIRAGIACNLIGSRNTSIRLRCKTVRGDTERADERLMPIWGPRHRPCRRSPWPNTSNASTTPAGRFARTGTAQYRPTSRGRCRSWA